MSWSFWRESIHAVSTGWCARRGLTNTCVAHSPRWAATVSTSVSGDSFTVKVDGKSIDCWDDDRFPMGGIGFTGAPDDPARLYWVRLSSTELTAKEYQTR